MTHPRRWTLLIVLVANAALLVLQLVAGRLLAPFIGCSLETWTAIIGAILAGISLGNAAGGRLADRRGDLRTLRIVLLAGAGAIVVSLLCAVGLRGTTVLAPVPLHPRILGLTFVVCFGPAFVLSLLTPLAIRILLPDVSRTGGVVGLVYALGTVGSLVGNFLTGFVLLAHLSTDAICWGLALILAGLAALTRPDAPALSQAIEPAPDAAAAPVSEPLSVGEPLSVPAACALVFAASFCAMTLELAATRLAAPVLGVSLYTWTGIIGVVLAGTAIGNFAGGTLADERPGREVLGGTLLVAGLSLCYLLALYPVLAQAPWLGEMHLIARVLIWSCALYLPTMIALGMISPQITRLAVRELSRAGRVSGHIYAASCAGAIAGTFATGFVLLRVVGVVKVILAVAVLLALAAIPAGRLATRPRDLVAATLLFAVCIGALGARGALTSSFALETNYFSIQVTSLQRKGSPESYRQLILDNLIHSVVRGEEVEEDGRRVWRPHPSHLGYPYEQVQAEMAIAASASRDPNILVIGGGAYTVPRWVSTKLPRARCDVVEIDPGVTEVSHRLLGLRRDTPLRSYHMDGRQFVQEISAPGQYDLVIQDAVNDLAVPYHLMTREYFDAVRRIMTPDGVLLVSVIDHVGRGRLFRSAVETLRRTFAHVQPCLPRNDPGSPGRTVVILYASRRRLVAAELEESLRRAGALPMLTSVEPPETGPNEAAPPVLLTDTYVPVDNLISIAMTPTRPARTAPEL